MNLLFVTQKVDRQDDVLGFVHRWLEKLAQRCDRLTVICLEQGECCLPGTVTVRSLGKEHRASRLQYVRRFYSYAWRLRREYDTVLVHMNPVYVVMGFLFWRLRGCKVFMWYNHEYGNLLAKTAVRLVRTVFFTSPFSFAARYENGWRMPAGIDTEIFAPVGEEVREENALLYVGRISTIKKVDVLIDAVQRLHDRGRQVVLQIAGAPGQGDESYYQRIKKQAARLENAGVIRFLGKVPNRETPDRYCHCRILFNLSPPGLFDKTVLEAMACESLVLVSSAAFREALPDRCLFRENDPADLAAKIEALLDLPEEKQRELGRQFRQYVVEHHSLETLVDQLVDHAGSNTRIKQ